MFGCIGGLFRLIFIVVILAILGGAVYYYTKRHPEGPSWKEGVASIKEKVETAKLGAEVKAALSLRESLRNLDIMVTAEQDVVTLRGKVPSADLSKTATSIAASVPGVRQVVNLLDLDSAAGRAGAGDDRSIGEKVDDEALELKVRAAFRLDRQLVDAGFEVKATRRAVSLSSATATADQKKRALDVARSVEGVKSVTQ